MVRRGSRRWRRRSARYAVVRSPARGDGARGSRPAAAGRLGSRRRWRCAVRCQSLLVGLGSVRDPALFRYAPEVARGGLSASSGSVERSVICVVGGVPAGQQVERIRVPAAGCGTACDEVQALVGGEFHGLAGERHSVTGRVHPRNGYRPATAMTGVPAIRRAISVALPPGPNPLRSHRVARFSVPTRSRAEMMADDGLAWPRYRPCWLPRDREDLDASAVKVGHVASRQRGALGAADGRDQRVEAGDGFPGSLAAAGDDGVVFCGCGADRQNLVFEGRGRYRRRLRRGGPRLRRPSGSRAMPYRPPLCERDGRGA